MSETPDLSRRSAVKTAAGAIAATALADIAIPAVHAAQDSAIRVALIGCGGRGTGAAANAMDSRGGPVKLWAMADVFEDQLNGSYNGLERSHRAKMEVPKERRFIGMDSYKAAMDTLRPGDVAIFATPPAFRWVHFSYAITKRLNVFMEKPVTVDAPTTVRMLKLGEESERLGLKVGVGLMCRHCPARRELRDRIVKDELGDLSLIRAYRVAGPTASGFSEKKPANQQELHYQIRRFHSFLWASGGAFSDFLIHNIDEGCWMKGEWPTEAKGYGGRHYRGNYVDQNFDSYTVEYTFRDGAKMMLEGRLMTGCSNEFATYVHGTKGSAIVSASGHTPARVRTFKGQKIGDRASQTWAFPVEKEGDPYQHEWDDLMAAIRNNRAYNEVKRGAEVSLVTSMGRMACHTGRNITFAEMLKVDHEFAPGLDKFTLQSDAPVRADKDGKYPVPAPGRQVRREY